MPKSPQCSSADPALLSALIAQSRAGAAEHGLALEQGISPVPTHLPPLVLLEGCPLLSAAGRPALGRPAPKSHPGETQPARPDHCSQLRASVALNQQEPSGDFRFSTAPPQPLHLGASLSGRCLSPVSLSKAVFATLPPAEAVARGCSEAWGQPLQHVLCRIHTRTWFQLNLVP